MLRGLILGILLTVIVAAGSGYLILRSGIIPANADAKPGSLERFIAGMSLRATLRNEAPKIRNPVPLTDAKLIAGIKLYRKHCLICHGTAAGDAAPSAIGRGENPGAPQLASKGVEDDPEGWTFWKIAHGIRWTGMPSWKDVLTDSQIWTLTLFLKHMDRLPPGPEAAWRATTADGAVGAPTFSQGSSVVKSEGTTGKP